MAQKPAPWIFPIYHSGTRGTHAGNVPKVAIGTKNATCTEAGTRRHAKTMPMPMNPWLRERAFTV